MEIDLLIKVVEIRKLAMKFLSHSFMQTILTVHHFQKQKVKTFYLKIL